MHTTSGKLLISLYAASLALAGCMAAETASSAAAPADQGKIAPPVEAAAQELEKGESLEPGARADTQGRLQVYVYVTDASTATLNQLTRAGLLGASGSAEMGVVQGWIAPDALTSLAGLDCVRNITLPRYAVPR
jgi:hypothetical protein